MESDKHLPNTNGKHKIRICLGSSCFSKSKERNLQYIEQYLIMHELKASVDFSGHLCEELCGSGPIIEIDGSLYTEVMPSHLGEILDSHFAKK